MVIEITCSRPCASFGHDPPTITLDSVWIRWNKSSGAWITVYKNSAVLDLPKARSFATSSFSVPQSGAFMDGIKAFPLLKNLTVIFFCIESWRACSITAFQRTLRTFKEALLLLTTMVWGFIRDHIRHHTCDHKIMHYCEAVLLFSFTHGCLNELDSALQSGIMLTKIKWKRWFLPLKF